jgi:hypothetical protein
MGPGSLELARHTRTFVLSVLAISAALLTVQCGTAGGSASSGSPPPTPPATNVTVSISPATAAVYLGSQQQMTATVSGTTNTAVTWEANGTAGGDTVTGTITAGGLYTAPAILPSTATVTITAVSQADPSANGTASVTIESNVQVTISPASANVATGGSQQFSATVTGSGNPDSAVNWNLTGGACASGCGTLTVSGNTATYTAPTTVPSPASVSVTAVSVADPSKSATANVTIAAGCSPAISISPATASLGLGAQQAFTATVCFSTNQNVAWSIAGSGCSGTNCGTVAATGANTATYTAPGSLPPANPVMLVATSAANSSETATASIAITSSCSPAISISPSSATIALGQQESFTATVCFSTNPDVTWSVAGTGCSASNCGAVSATGANTATYTAPGSLPPANPVTLVATSAADASQSASAIITVVSGISVSLTPLSAEVAVNNRAALTPTVEGSSNTNVTWTVNGVSNGNGAVGEICVAGSNPCSAPSGPSSGSVEYLAPASAPNPAGVYVVATSSADTTRSATAEMTVVAHIEISVWPANAVVAPSGTVEFAAQIVGTENTGVNWQVSCGGSSGCGSINSSGVYTAPSADPNPNQITITATSQDDSTQTATATVAVSSGPAIASLAPASVTASEADSFPLSITGMNFVPTSPGPGSQATIDGSAQNTTCASATLCTLTIAASEVAAAGTILVQVQNPGGAQSNTLPLAVAPADGSPDVISLSSSEPIAGARDIVAVEPTTAGSGTGPITVLFAGLLDTSTNTCNVNESPITLAIPSSGAATYSICLGGEGLNASYTYTIAGSQASDVTVSNPQAFAGSLVELTVTVSSAAAPGPRAIIVTDPADDRAVGSGAIDVE